MLQTSDESRELKVLETVASDPEVRQADIATQLGVAVGTVNWVLKRLVSKGYVKVKRIGRWKWRYLLTPKGMARKAKLTKEYVRYSMALYREVRNEASDLAARVEAAGYDTVALEAPSDNEIADIVRLTCVERGMTVRDRQARKNGGSQPKLMIEGRRIKLVWPVGLERE